MTWEAAVGHFYGYPMVRFTQQSKASVFVVYLQTKIMKKIV